MSGEKWIIDSNAFIHLGQKATASELRSMMGVIRTMNQRLRITHWSKGRSISGSLPTSGQKTAATHKIKCSY